MIALLLSPSEDAVFSSTPASVGGHAALTFVPGAALWGALAARIYGSVGKRSFDTLHSGKVRLSPGFPVTATGQPAFPMPQTLQEPKHRRGGIANERITGAVWNTVALGPTEQDAGGKERRIAGEALKRWFLAADGSVVRPETAERGKAALEMGGRRVASGQFFQYEHVTATRQWMCLVDADEPADAEFVADEMEAELLRLGRSKRREFGGRFAVRRVGGWTDPRTRQFNERTDRRLILWCLSDLALTDACGAPDLSPGPASFGLPEFSGRLDPRTSVMTTRRYSPYNTYLRANDREQAVIEAGSVLVYELDRPLPLRVFQKPLGQWVERGLGMVWPNPPLLMGGRPAEQLGHAAPPPGDAEPQQQRGPDQDTPEPFSEEDNRLVEQIRAYAEEQADGRVIAKCAEDLAANLLAAMEQIARNGDLTPGPSQWSRVAEAAQVSAGIDPLKDALFREQPDNNGICAGSNNPEWSRLRPRLRTSIEQLAYAPERHARRADVFRRALAGAAQRLAREWKPTERRR